MNIGEIKQQAYGIVTTLNDNLPAISQQVEGDYRTLLSELDWMMEGTNSEELKEVENGIKQAIVNINAQKSQMMNAAQQLMQYVNRL